VVIEIFYPNKKIEIPQNLNCLNQTIHLKNETISNKTNSNSMYLNVLEIVKFSIQTQG